MGSRLLNGSPQLNVRVTMLPLTPIVLLSTVTLGTNAGTPELGKRVVATMYSYTFM